MSLFEGPNLMYSSDVYQKRRRAAYKGRTTAARRIQTSYRRYRAANSDQRSLAGVVRAHRKANPYQIQPSSGRTVTFWRKTEVNIALGQTTGFGAVGNNVNWGFCLGRVIGFVNGAFVYSIPVPSSSEFQALFDYYRVNAVKMQVFFTKNNDPLSTTTGASHGMPIIIIANDFDDIAETMTLNAMNERIGSRHIQFDSTNSRGINHYIKPAPSTVVVQTDVATGVQSTSNAGIAFGRQWLDVAASNIVHNGVKVFYDNQGITNNITLGNMTFVFDICYEFKGYR